MHTTRFSGGGIKPRNVEQTKQHHRARSSQTRAVPLLSDTQMIYHRRGGVQPNHGGVVNDGDGGDATDSARVGATHKGALRGSTITC